MSGLHPDEREARTFGGLIVHTALLRHTECCGHSVFRFVPGLAINANRIGKAYQRSTGGAQVSTKCPENARGYAIGGCESLHPGT